MRINTIRDKSNSLDLRFGISENADTASRFLVFANGRSEWIEKYEHFPEDLRVSEDTGFLIFDHRGQGGSGGARAWIDSYDTYASDMAYVVNEATQGKPFNLICHSMGSLISLVAIMKGLIKPRCVVLSSPLLGLPNHHMPAPAAYYTSSLLTHLSLGHVHSGAGRYWRPPFEKNVLTRSHERYQNIQNSPFPIPSPTFQWIKASYEATKFVREDSNQSKITMPILVLCGTEERVVDPDAIQRWVSSAAQNAKSGVDFHWIQDGLHELLYESRPIYEPVLNLIRGWFDKKGFPL
jgi:alpha-beta hydrolase superfamily lysophospholipase